MSDEQESMDRVYRRRQVRADKYSLENAGNLYNYNTLHSALQAKLNLLFSDLSQPKLLDLGAGELFWVEEFTKMGLAHKNCIGADILTWRLRNGRRAGRVAQAVAASAARLPLMDGSVDIVVQMTMMTSILDRGVRQKVAAEMMRALRPGGYILWYDFRFNNPANPDTRSIGLKEIKRLFPGYQIEAHKITLLPQLARLLGRLSTGLLNFLSFFPILRTHYLAVIGPKREYEN